MTPLISRSMSKMASMRLTASSAIGEIGAAFLPRLALAAMSASSKNLRLAWLQHSASTIGPGFHWGIKSGVAAEGVGLEDAAPVRQMTLRMLAAAIARGVE